MPTSPNPTSHRFLSLAGEVAETFAFNRSLGQIYGYLFLADKPVSLEEIAGACLMSKGNAALNLRTLEAWGAVRRIGVPGTRKDHFAANTDLSGLALRRLQEGIARRLETLRSRFDALKSDPDWKAGGTGVHGKRLAELDHFLSQVEKALSLLPHLGKLKAFL